MGYKHLSSIKIGLFPAKLWPTEFLESYSLCVVRIGHHYRAKTISFSIQTVLNDFQGSNNCVLLKLNKDSVNE